MRIALNAIFILFQDSRITVQCENSTECYLYIAEVRETDSGLYQCQANISPGSWETRYIRTSIRKGTVNNSKGGSMMNDYIMP